MDIYSSLFSPEKMLNDQLARHIFDILPEDGPMMIIVDTQMNCWPSDPQKFEKMEMSESFISHLVSNINDGHEPLITEHKDSILVASQLRTQKTNCGSIIFIMSKNPEQALVNSELLEIIINQTNLIVSLLEKNNLLYELHMKNNSVSMNYPGNSNFN